MGVRDLFSGLRSGSPNRRETRETDHGKDRNSLTLTDIGHPVLLHSTSCLLSSTEGVTVPINVQSSKNATSGHIYSRPRSESLSYCQNKLTTFSNDNGTTELDDLSVKSKQKSDSKNDALARLSKCMLSQSNHDGYKNSKPHKKLGKTRSLGLEEDCLQFSLPSNYFDSYENEIENDRCSSERKSLKSSFLSSGSPKIKRSLFSSFRSKTKSPSPSRKLISPPSGLMWSRLCVGGGHEDQRETLFQESYIKSEPEVDSCITSAKPPIMKNSRSNPNIMKVGSRSSTLRKQKKSNKTNLKRSHSFHSTNNDINDKNNNSPISKLKFINKKNKKNNSVCSTSHETLHDTKSLNDETFSKFIENNHLNRPCSFDDNFRLNSCSTFKPSQTNTSDPNRYFAKELLYNGPSQNHNYNQNTVCENYNNLFSSLSNGYKLYKPEMYNDVNIADKDDSKSNFDEDYRFIDSSQYETVDPSIRKLVELYEELQKSRWQSNRKLTKRPAAMYIPKNEQIQNRSSVNSENDLDHINRFLLEYDEPGRPVSVDMSASISQDSLEPKLDKSVSVEYIKDLKSSNMNHSQSARNLNDIPTMKILQLSKGINGLNFNRDSLNESLQRRNSQSTPANMLPETGMDEAQMSLLSALKFLYTGKELPSLDSILDNGEMGDEAISSLSTSELFENSSDDFIDIEELLTDYDMPRENTTSNYICER